MPDPMMNQTASDLVAQRGAAAAAQNIQVNASVGEHWSLGYLDVEIVDGNPSGAITQAFGVIRSKTYASFFDYGINKALNFSSSNPAAIKASRATTSLETAYQLPARTCMAIERITLTPELPMVRYSAAQLSSADPTTVRAWTNGALAHVHVADPLGMMTPQDIAVGPLTLHHAIWQAVKEAAVLDVLRGAGTTGGKMLAHASRFGTSNESYLTATRAAGDGRQDDVGVFWDFPNEIDGELSFRLVTEDEVVFPFAIPVTTPGGSTRLTLPTRIMVPVRMTVAGPMITTGKSVNG